MRAWLSILLLLFASFGFADPFADPYSRMSLDIPEGFSLAETEKKEGLANTLWWYEFSDLVGRTITIEIEEYNDTKSLSEHFYRSLIEEEENSSEQLVYEGLEFRELIIGNREFCKCKLRILSIEGIKVEPLCFSDYLFVNDHYGFSISLMERGDTPNTDSMMQNLLQSVSFIEE